MSKRTRDTVVLAVLVGVLVLVSLPPVTSFLFTGKIVADKPCPLPGLTRFYNLCVQGNSPMWWWLGWLTFLWTAVVVIAIDSNEAIIGTSKVANLLLKYPYLGGPVMIAARLLIFTYERAEPYVARSIPYILRAVSWVRKFRTPLGQL